ncbi:polysaccharide deacetylase family protein [Gelidibacter maritimus]|uniref:Polysaccharide deacetylase family protein n=1 Tax=Gelidibacter maritimus TaxID=2761487 RepID=A0A7W2M7H0_9FLAO|nr:polysaccharide deacetylase family protein [Gelidibacter maritimus]MBA6153891.1 polysaccharide deacetylase family protein [Gelidibacter maritimus]
MKNFRILIALTILLFLLLAILDTYVGIALWWYGLLLLLWFLMMAIGSFSMSWKFYLKPITSNKVLTDKKIALTFDDGPNPEFTLKVLQILKDYNAKATFFCIGQHIETYPEILKAIVQDGHDIGNHSFSHNLMIDFNSTERWLQEIKQTDNSIHKISGKKTTLFRPPFGVTTPKLARALKVTEHKVIGWNIRSFDTVISNPQKILKRITKRVHPGAIILLHDKQSNVLLVLEHLLQFLQEHKYHAVTINELLHDN